MLMKVYSTSPCLTALYTSVTFLLLQKTCTISDLLHNLIESQNVYEKFFDSQCSGKDFSQVAIVNWMLLLMVERNNDDVSRCTTTIVS